MKELLKEKVHGAKDFLTSLRQQLANVSQDNVVEEPEMEEINMQAGID